MAETTINAASWIASTCGQFQRATGFPLEYHPVVADEANRVEGELRSQDDYCWITDVNGGEGRLGFLSIGLPVEGVSDAMFPFACEVGEMVAQLMGRVMVGDGRLASRTDELSRIVNLGRRTRSTDDTLSALSDLLDSVVHLTGFDQAAFFLLNPDEQELQLRVSQRGGGSPVPYPRRPLHDDVPDVCAFASGAIVLDSRLTAGQSRWLPPDCPLATCLPVRSDTSPLGSLWAFGRQRTGPEVKENHVLESIANQISAVLERLVLRKYSDREYQLRRELQVASESQNIDFLQGVSDELGIDVAAVCNSRYEVGGDLCELIPMGAGRALVAVGDACGKSIPAAMIMASVRGSLRTAAASHRDSIERTDVVMQELNQTLHAIAPTGRFMTLLLGVVDTINSTFCFTSAGHPNPILVRGGQTREIGRSHGLMLGASEDEDYDRSLIKLQSRDTLVVFSDGISEAMSCDRRLFRSSGIMQAIRGCRSGTPRKILDAITSNLDSHTHGNDGADDRTLLVLQTKSGP